LAQAKNRTTIGRFNFAKSLKHTVETNMSILFKLPTTALPWKILLYSLQNVNCYGRCADTTISLLSVEHKKFVA
jgi:hypothetical protein